MRHLFPLILFCLAGCVDEYAGESIPFAGTQTPVIISMPLRDFMGNWLRESQISEGRVSELGLWYWNPQGRAVHQTFGVEQPCDLIVEAETYPYGDTNFDKTVNFFDFAYMAKTWKKDE